MGISVSANVAKSLDHHIWLVDLPPHQVRFFGGGASSSGDRSIVLIDEPHYDNAKKSLQFDADKAMALNIGTSSETVVVGIESTKTHHSAIDRMKLNREITLGPGDRQFLAMAERLLPVHMQKTAAALLNGVRQRTAGDLKKGKARNFYETPDNFWYVIIQPRVQHLQITVRGEPSHFEGVSRLQILDDRGNTRFKITGESDIGDALKLIFHAKRKN